MAEPDSDHQWPSNSNLNQSIDQNLFVLTWQLYQMHNQCGPFASHRPHWSFKEFGWENLPSKCFQGPQNKVEEGHWIFENEDLCLRVEEDHQSMNLAIQILNSTTKSNKTNKNHHAQNKIQPLNLLLFTFYLPTMAWILCCWWNKASNMYVWSARGKDCQTRRLRGLKRQDKTESALSQ